MQVSARSDGHGHERIHGANEIKEVILMPAETENWQKGTHRTGGGAATQSGTDYQNRVAAWASVCILAEENATLRWNLPSYTSFQYIRCETEQPVDDIMIGTSDGGFVFIQAKRTINLEKSSSSALASTIRQFVKQFVAYRDATGEQPWERPLNPAADRLVLATGTLSSLPIRETLGLVLDRLRTLIPEQPLECAATNEDEHRALLVMRNHISNIWNEEYGGQPTDDEVRQLLSLIWITTLDVDEDGSQEIEAKSLLKSSIIRDNKEAESAWNTIIQICAALAKNRSGADRSQLQKGLLNKGIDLKASPSYQKDIERLKEYSISTINQLADLSTICIGKSNIKIDRESTHALKTTAQKGSIVVVGEPGAGKSGALYDVVTDLQSEQFDVVFIAVDRVEAQSLAALRTEIGTSHEIIEALENWPGLKPAFLVIDALDAARSEQSMRTFQSLISLLIKNDTRWRVIASIRKYDLRNNTQFQQLFSGTPPTEYVDKEFNKICHINIPNLTDEEFRQIENQSDILVELAQNSTPALSQLLRNLFNLRLMGELISLQIPLTELTSIGRQHELLDRYWLERVIRVDGQGDSREDVLRKIASSMVRNRSIKINRAEIAQSVNSKILNELLSSHVITEWQAPTADLPERYILAFPHNILYDYAVSRLLLRGTSEHLVSFLANNPELVLAIWPSIALHFQYLWQLDSTRDLLWNSVAEVIRNDEIPEIGKLIGPGVASEWAMRIEDFEPLFHMFEGTDVAIQQIAEKACRHVIGSLLSLPDNSCDKLVGTESGPWEEFMERLGRNMTDSTALLIRPLLVTLCERAHLFTEQQRNLIGKVARQLLVFALTSPIRNQWLVNHALQAVCRTFASDVNASAQLIRHSLHEEHLKSFGVEEMPTLAREVNELISLDAKLVEDIYKAIFAHNEDSEEKTQIGGSQIIGMISTRKQDFAIVQYELVEAFPKFLQTAPENAIRALISALNSYINIHHETTEDLQEKTFDFGGLKAQIKADYSLIWDNGNAYHHDDLLRMLNAFEDFLIESTQNKELTACRHKIVGIIAQESNLAVMWRRLLRCGTRTPDTIGIEIKSVAWAKPLLTCRDTRIDVGNFIQSIFRLLDAHERERIESAILSLTKDSVSDQESELMEVNRNRLLGCLPEEHITTARARKLLHHLRDNQALSANEPRFPSIECSSEPYGEKEYLAEKGVPVEKEENELIRLMEVPIEEFNKTHLNSIPSAEAIQTVFPLLRDLHEHLLNANRNDVHPLQRDYAWGTLAEACQHIASSDELSGMSDIGSFAKIVLLDAAKHPDPVHRPESDHTFDEFPSWESPAPRINAACGLTLLARSSEFLDQKVLAAIEILANDDVPAVRFQVVRHIVTLYETAPKLMWTIIENRCEIEQSTGVLQGLLVGTLYRLAGAHADRVLLLTKKIFDRSTEGAAGTISVRKSCVSIVCGLYVYQGNQASEEVICGIIDSPEEYLEETRYLMANMGEMLTYGLIDPENQEHKAIRSRAFAIAEKALSSVSKELEIEKSRLNSGVQLSTDEMEILKGLVKIIDAIGSTLYFASGAFDENLRQARQDPKILTANEKKQFLSEADNLLNQLAGVGLIPSVTHHLLQTLEAFISLEPVMIFEKIGKAVDTAQQGQYEYEFLGANLVVKIVERYIAEYSWIFQEHKKCQRTLLNILDIFVTAGWPSARRLIHRLDEIYR